MLIRSFNLGTHAEQYQFFLGGIGNLSTLLGSPLVSNNPSFRMLPTFGASSLGCAASAFRYARCSSITLAAWMVVFSNQLRAFSTLGFLALGELDLFPVMQTLIIVLQDRNTLEFARVVTIGVGVDDVTREQFLPEGKTARDT